MPIPADRSPREAPDPTRQLSPAHAPGGADLDVALFVLFFASGFVALLYQVIWQRMLGLIAGLDLYAVTLIVAVYMLGMGVGSSAGGLIADRLAPRRLLAAFACAELVVAACALVSTTVYRDVFYERAASGGESVVFAGLAASTLLVPTIFMGLTLPVLSKALTQSVDAAAHKIAGLYGWNTIGAAVGAWLGSSVLVRTFGYERSLWAGAAINVCCAVGAILLRPRVTDSPSSDEVGAPPTVTAPASHERGLIRWPWSTWLAVYFLSGFFALGLEMVWFRLLGVLLKSTAYTFPLLLSLYLLGVGVGSLLGRWLARLTRQPLRWFLLAQAAVTLYAAWSVNTLVWALHGQARLENVRRYLASYEPIDFAFDFFALKPAHAAFYLALPALLILPPTLLMGVSFPLLQRGSHSDLASLGRRVGMLQTSNILGSTSGVVVVGLVLIDGFGTAGTLRALTLGSLVFLLLAAFGTVGREGRRARVAAVAAAVALSLGTAWLVPSSVRLWSGLHGAKQTQVLYAEDGSGLTVLRSSDPSFRRRTDVYVNGLGQSWVPFSGVHSYLGLVPALLHPAPKKIAIIGLGSGDTVYSAAGRPETERVDCIEIIGGQIDTLRALHERSGYEGLAGLLHDPRVRFIVGDGRRFVMQTPERFDIIEADALRPASAYAGTLYSREYFELMRQRLASGGLAVTWAPTVRVHSTFIDVFPYVASVDPMLIGSNEPIRLDADAVRARARVAATVEHYTKAGIDLESHVQTLLGTFELRSKPSVPPAEGLLNTDLFPRDELRTP